MLALKIFLGILLFLVLLLFLRVKISVISDGTDTKLLLRILGIPVKLFPRKQRKQKIRLSDYTPRGLRRAQKKKDKKALKEALKEKHKKPADEESEKTPLSETVSQITALAKKIISKFFRHLRIDVTRIRISVGTPDAAKTGILYGAVCQGVAYLTEVLDHVTNIKKTKKTEISVCADFVSGKTAADINISFSLTVWQALDILLGAAFEYFKSKSNPNKRK